MAAVDVLPWIPGGALLVFAMVSLSRSRRRKDFPQVRMSLYLAFFGLLLCFVTTGFGDFPRLGFFVLFCTGLGALLGYADGAPWAVSATKHG